MERVSIPTKNPKHNRNRVNARRQVQYAEESSFNFRLLLMGIIFVAVVGLVAVFILYGDVLLDDGDEPILKVENGDKKV